MFESEESDSSVLRKSMSEADEWKKEEVHLEEVVLTYQLIANQLFMQRLIICHVRILVLENSPSLMNRR